MTCGQTEWCGKPHCHICNAEPVRQNGPGMSDETKQAYARQTEIARLESRIAELPDWIAWNRDRAIGYAEDMRGHSERLKAATTRLGRWNCELKRNKCLAGLIGHKTIVRELRAELEECRERLDVLVSG